MVTEVIAGANGTSLGFVGFEMSLLLFAALLGYIIASRIGQSAIIGTVLVGILIGPSVLGLITYDNFVEIIAHFGAIFLLFAIGLEVKLKEIYTLRNSLIAVCGVIVPWIGGYLVSLSFGYSNIESIFVGTALTATSIAITANVLKEMGKLDTEAAKTIIGAAVVDDVLGLLALSITVSISTTGSIEPSHVLEMAFVAVLFLVGSTFFGIFLSRYMAPLDEWGSKRNAPFLAFFFALMIAFAYSTLAELVGLSAIVGAFIAGVSLERVELEHLKEGARFFEVIFAAIFFVSLGVLVDIKAIPEVLWFLVAIIVVAIVTKMIGCWIPARLMGLSFRDSTIVGIGMSPRGEVAVIVALFGLSAGVIGQSVYVAIVLMSLITTLVVPLFVPALYAKDSK